MWDSTGPKGGLGAKFERAMVSEVVGIDAVYGVKTSSRIDPLGIRKDAGPVYVLPDGDWTLNESLAKKEKGKPGHARERRTTLRGESREHDLRRSLNGSKSTGEYLAGGVTISRAEQTIVLSLPARRRLRFPIGGKGSKEIDNAARTVLAALGLCAATLAAEAGYDLRSRCLLWPIEPLNWKVLGRPGAPADGFYARRRRCD